MYEFLKERNSSDILEQLLMNQNSIQEEIKSKLMSGYACSHTLFVFQFVIQKYKDQEIQNSNFS